jgi:hypothetical protein
MKYKIFMILCLFIFIFSACGTKENYAAESVQITTAPSLTPTLSPEPTITNVPSPAPTSEPTITPEATSAPEPTKVAKEEKKHTKSYELFREKAGSDFTTEDGTEWTIQIADGFTIYPRHTAILFDDSELLCVVERFRTVDPLSNKRYVMIDFSIMNLSSSDFESSKDYLTLTDSNGYTYNSTIYILDDIMAPVGDLDISLKPGDMSRGEVVFEVPYKSTEFILRCDIPGDDIGRTSFVIDLSKCVNQNGIQSSSIN